jgi:hypothetical protein
VLSYSSFRSVKKKGRQAGKITGDNYNIFIIQEYYSIGPTKILSNVLLSK